MKIYIVLLGLFAFGQSTPVISNGGLSNVTHEENVSKNLSVTVSKDDIKGSFECSIDALDLSSVNNANFSIAQLMSNGGLSNITNEDNFPDNYTINVSKDDIKIYFRNRNQGSLLYPIDLHDTNSVAKAGFSSDKPTVFLIHGWLCHSCSEFNTVVANAVLKVNDANVFIVDWSEKAIGLYTIARRSVPHVARFLGEFINDMVNHNHLNLDQTFMVGHSLGAHVAGLAGSALNGKIQHIVGLDPALPGFQYDNPSKRLDRSNAKFVIVIHTNGGLLGFHRSLGHVDYRPNGGRTQPGCERDKSGSCSHLRSYMYYEESIVSGGFHSHKCDSYELYQEGKCKSAATSLMGGFTPNFEACGDYYLNTNKVTPYAQH